MLNTALVKMTFVAALAAFAIPATVTAQNQSSEKLHLFMDQKDGDLLSLTHGIEGGPTIYPDNLARLTDDAVKAGLVLSAVMRNRDGQVVAIATEIEHFPEGQRPGVNWETYWTIYFPGEGSLFGFETEAIPEQHLPLFIARAGGKGWKGENRAKIASGPREDGWGNIIGGTGKYAGATGKFAEFYTLRELPVAGGIIGTLELEIVLD